MLKELEWLIPIFGQTYRIPLPFCSYNMHVTMYFYSQIIDDGFWSTMKSRENKRRKISQEKSLYYEKLLLSYLYWWWKNIYTIR